MTDVMRYLIDDEATRVIALFIESIRQPAEFLALASEALAKGKPIVAIKVGRSQAGAKVAKAHTGSLVGDDAVVDAVFRQNGVIRVDSLEDLVITAGPARRDGAAARPPVRVRHGHPAAPARSSPTGRGRGHRDTRVRAADRGAAARRCCPTFAATQNPIDVTGYILIDNRAACATRSLTVADDPGLDALVLASDLPKIAPPDPAPMHRVVPAAPPRSSGAAAKPIVVMGNTLTDITAVRQAGRRGDRLPGRARRHPPRPDRARPRRPLVARLLPVAPGRAPLPPPEPPRHRDAAGRAGSRLVGAPRLAVPRRARHPRRARRARREPGGRGGGRRRARLPRRGQAGRRRRRAQERHRRRQGRPAHAPRPCAPRTPTSSAPDSEAGADVQGALVQPMRDGGIELLVGIVTDPAWGLVLAVGLGGVWVEILQGHRRSWCSRPAATRSCRR